MDDQGKRGRTAARKRNSRYFLAAYAFFAGSKRKAPHAKSCVSGIVSKRCKPRDVRRLLKNESSRLQYDLLNSCFFGMFPRCGFSDYFDLIKGILIQRITLSPRTKKRIHFFFQIEFFDDKLYGFLINHHSRNKGGNE